MKSGIKSWGRALQMREKWVERLGGETELVLDELKDITVAGAWSERAFGLRPAWDNPAGPLS